jgi:hypothetical protein
MPIPSLPFMIHGEVRSYVLIFIETMVPIIYKTSGCFFYY